MFTISWNWNLISQIKGNGSMVTIETNFFLTDEKKRSTLIIDKPFEPIEINKALIEDNLIKELEETT